MNKLIEHNEILDTPLFFPFHLESPKEKMITLKYQILKQQLNDIIFLTIGYNKILHKSNISNTDSF